MDARSPPPQCAFPRATGGSKAERVLAPDLRSPRTVSAKHRLPALHFSRLSSASLPTALSPRPVNSPAEQRTGPEAGGQSRGRAAAALGPT